MTRRANTGSALLTRGARTGLPDLAGRTLLAGGPYLTRRTSRTPGRPRRAWLTGGAATPECQKSEIFVLFVVLRSQIAGLAHTEMLRVLRRWVNDDPPP